MIKLLDILNEIANTYKDDSNTWTHITDKDEVINSIKSKNKWLGVNEDLSDFSYVINTRRLSADKQNTNVPNFYKGSIYPGSTQKYLITFTPKQSYPGDNFESLNWKEVDYPLIPNSSRVNQTSFKNSRKIGVLKPEYRDIKNFKFYKYDNISKKYVEFDIKKFNPLNEIITETDPKIGTGKKPKGSGRRLYTDENPKDTVSIKFKTVQDIKDTLSKTSFKSKPHARQSQIINLIHQRVRAAYNKAKDPEVKARLKKGLVYITAKKEASKRKTQRLKND